MKLALERSNTEKTRFARRGGRHAASRREWAGAVSAPGRSIEEDARKFTGAVEQWRSTPKPPGRKTPLGRRLDEIRKRIKASGQPLLSSWEELDRELADRRGEPLEEPDR